jgi:hypothetical protein
MGIDGVRITRPLHAIIEPTAAQVQDFLTTQKREGRSGRPPVITSGTRVLLNDDVINAHSVMESTPQGQGIKAGVNAPLWLRDAASDRMKVHRAAQFDIGGGYTLWFVESTTYKAGWFLDSAAAPMFVNEPGQFRPAKPGEDIFAERF